MGSYTQVPQSYDMKSTKNEPNDVRVALMDTNLDNSDSENENDNNRAVTSVVWYVFERKLLMSVNDLLLCLTYIPLNKENWQWPTRFVDLKKGKLIIFTLSTSVHY